MSLETKTNRPAPPECLSGEAVLEWQRVVAELEAQGRLDKADRAILTLYCLHWQTHHEAARHVVEFGSVIKHANGSPYQNPFYKTMKETAPLLRGLLQDLGLTPTKRPEGGGGGGDLEW